MGFMIPVCRSHDTNAGEYFVGNRLVQQHGIYLTAGRPFVYVTCCEIAKMNGVVPKAVAWRVHALGGPL